MSFESLTIPVEPEKQDLSILNIDPISKSVNELKEIHGNYMFTSLKPDQKIILDFKKHPVFQGFVWAYKNHRPITISPDIFWLLIIQAFSNHVSEKAEELRPMFVNFTDKRELRVKRADLNIHEMKSEDWEKYFFPEFVSQISGYTGEDLVDVLTPNFTTTTPVSLAVSQLTIMSSMKSYFDYMCSVSGCGFPYITIEGSVEDWTKIVDKLSLLAKYKFEWFTNAIIPSITKIIDTKKGRVDTQFWKTMIRIKDGTGFYDPSYVDGWFTSFFPFNKYGSRFGPGKITERTELQDEMMNVHFILEIIGQAEYSSCFYAGFVGLSQDEKTASIKPEVGWFIRKPAVLDQQMKEILYQLRLSHFI